MHSVNNKANAVVRYAIRHDLGETEVDLQVRHALDLIELVEIRRYEGRILLVIVERRHKQPGVLKLPAISRAGTLAGWAAGKAGINPGCREMDKLLRAAATARLKGIL